MNDWIPIKTRMLTESEIESFKTEGSDVSFMYDCLLPDDGQEVLITDRYGNVKTDTFYWDDGCYFETYCDDGDVVAWMPLPKPYKPESEGEERADITSEEAIAILIREIEGDPFVRTEYREQIHKALKMAIKALEQEPISEVLNEIRGEIIRYTDKHCNNGYILCESVCEILNSHIRKEQE